jgi:hypothetical protein
MVFARENAPKDLFIIHALSYSFCPPFINHTTSSSHGEKKHVAPSPKMVLLDTKSLNI